MQFNYPLFSCPSSTSTFCCLHNCICWGIHLPSTSHRQHWLQTSSYIARLLPLPATRTSFLQLHLLQSLHFPPRHPMSNWLQQPAFRAQLRSVCIYLIIINGGASHLVVLFVLLHVLVYYSSINWPQQHWHHWMAGPRVNNHLLEIKILSWITCQWLLSVDRELALQCAHWPWINFIQAASESKKCIPSPPPPPPSPSSDYPIMIMYIKRSPVRANDHPLYTEKRWRRSRRREVKRPRRANPRRHRNRDLIAPIACSLLLQGLTGIERNSRSTWNGTVEVDRTGDCVCAYPAIVGEFICGAAAAAARNTIRSLWWDRVQTYFRIDNKAPCLSVSPSVVPVQRDVSKQGKQQHQQQQQQEKK